MTKKYCIFLSALFCAFLGVFLVANAVSPDRTFSQMENRNLEQLPVPSVKTLLNGQFMKDFETYTTDQFVGRDGWIALKSTTERVLGMKENNNVYFAAGDTLISRFDEPDGEKVTNNLNYVNNFVENVDIPVTFSLIPTQACIWADRLPAGEIMPHGQDICSLSAKTGEGIDNLLEMVNLTAEMQELKANPNRSAHGAVIEARLDKGRGPVATLLVQNGTLKQGDVIIAGTAVGRVRAMTSAKGEKLTEAGPSVPVEIIGMGEVPGAGDDFHAVADERMARELVEQRKHEQKMAASAPVGKVSLEDLFSQIKQGEMKDLNIIVKADVQGSAEAVKASLEKLSNEEVRVRVIHCAVGAISESDVMLATTSNAIIVGFNVRPDNNAKESAARNNVDMRMYRVIYDCINEIETAMKGMLAPKFKEVELGQAEVRNVFRITGVGMVAGCYVTNGKMQRGAQMRLLRDNIVIYDGAIASLQRFKDSVKEVAQGYECGITFEKFQDIKEGDVIEAYLMEQIEV